MVPAVRPGLVILDVDLPGLGGGALYDHLRARPATATIPVLFMCAAAREGELAGRGIRDYLRKPFDLDDLLARVRAIFEEHVPLH